MSLKPHLGSAVRSLLKETQSLILSAEEHDFVEFAERFEGRAHGELCQDLWVLYQTSQKQSGYFVEFGAADGYTNSNTLLLEREYNWQGALAEPCPIFGNEISLRKSAFSSCIGIAPTSGPALLTVAPDPFKSSFEAFSTPDLHTASRSSGWQCEAQTETLDNFLRRAQAPPGIDYLSIDTEGSELPILQTLDWNAWNISLISVEHNYSSQRQGLFDLLTSKGYNRIFQRLSKWDDWYVKRS